MRKFFSFTVILVLSGCGEFYNSTQPQLYSLDGVKLISPAIENEQDPATFNQDAYMLHGERRLLIRFESLKNHVSDIAVGAGKKVTVEIAVVDGTDPDQAIRKLTLYPLLKNWMMRATWKNAHPFGLKGLWDVPGGDYEIAGAMVPSHKTLTGSTNQILSFDATQWFIDYPRGRKAFNGLILIANEPITVAGDKSGSFSPRILFDKYPTTTASTIRSF